MHPTRRLTRLQLIALDAVAAGLYLLFLVPPAALREDVPAWLAVPLTVAVGAPAALRRVRPVPVFLTVFAASLALWRAGGLLDPFLAAAFTLYPVALAARRSLVPTALTGTVTGIVMVAGVLAGSPFGQWRGFGVAALGTGLLAGSWTAGRMVRDRQLDAARSAAELAARAVAEERLRIARELHDVVAHSMSLIAIKAGTANHVMAVRPGEAQDALRVIETTSRTALAEMRQLLGVLRAGTPAPPLTPVPGAAGLPGLAERAEEAGVRVSLAVSGVDRLPEGVALSVYRIVQEALTNVVRHAAPATCLISVTGGDGQVRVEVSDDGPGARGQPPAAHTGHGLIGMRERVLMYGGDFHAGPRPEGGFAVSARIPCDP